MDSYQCSTCTELAIGYYHLENQTYFVCKEDVSLKLTYDVRPLYRDLSTEEKAYLDALQTHLTQTATESVSTFLEAANNAIQPLVQQIHQIEKTTQAQLQSLLTEYRKARDVLSEMAGRGWNELKHGRSYEGTLATWLKTQLTEEKLVPPAWLMENRLYLKKKAGDLENSGALSQAINVYQTCIDIERKLGLESDLADTLSKLGYTLDKKGEYSAAKEAYTEAVTLKKKYGIDSDVIVLLNNIGCSLEDMEEFDQAISYFTEAVAFSKENNRVAYQAQALINLIDLLQCHKPSIDAQPYIEELNLLPK